VTDLLTRYPLFSALLALTGLAAACGALLGYAARRFAAAGRPVPDANAVADAINDLLPQTQCGQCGHPGCRPYAEAIAAGEAINKCPPGGTAGIRALAALLGVEPLPLDEEHGEEKTAPMVAFIREEECIGCTKCILACPVDAILGAAKQMHTVISELCTGCDLCVEPCPVDCIDMIGQRESLHTWRWQWPDPLNPTVQIIATDSALRAEHRDRAP
jgi:Na+-translocating ferredoxin:NAD+ oxidoreductase subunit B